MTLVFKLIEYVTTNFYVFISLIKKAFQQTQSLIKYHKIDQFIKTSNCLQIFQIKGSFIKIFTKNCTLIELSLNKISRKFNKTIKSKVEEIIKEVPNKEFLKSLSQIFLYFNQILMDVDNLSPELIQHMEMNEIGPNFILQPFQFTQLLPPIQEKEFTLVLDLDETLIHFQESLDGGQFYLRPYSQEFIDKMHPLYELVIFTAAVKDYADWILDRLDPNKLISHRLYRCSTT